MCYNYFVNVFIHLTVECIPIATIQLISDRVGDDVRLNPAALTIT